MGETKDRKISNRAEKGQGKPKSRGSGRVALVGQRSREEQAGLSRQARQASKKRRAPGKPRRSDARLER